MTDSQSDPNVGCCAADFVDPVQGATVTLRLLYPTPAEARPRHFGPYALDLAMDAPAAGESLPLVVVSHGNGGTPWAYRGLAAHLARAGFVVAMPEHPGNGRSDNSLAGTVANLENRPRHLTGTIDAAFASTLVGPHISRGGVAVVGHSIGGYTALALAGGLPRALPWETPDGAMRPIGVTPDPRVRALVLLAPATPWLGKDGALAAVRVPILMMTGEKDDIAGPMHAAIVANGIPDPAKLDHRVVPGAGHFAFQTPFPPEMVRPDFPPSQDPPGFDRTAFQLRMCADVLRFLESL